MIKKISLAAITVFIVWSVLAFLVHGNLSWLSVVSLQAGLRA